MDNNSNVSRMVATDKIPPKRKPPPRRMMPFGLLNHVLEFISRTNLFVLCCIAACFSLVSYLAAFSCEISWILEAHGNLPTTSYLLCSGYFILFVASTILIHGLATGLPWGLFSWSVIIGALGIPELCLVMMITTQFWGLQSTHGLTELISYIIRLIINCLALLCVIPTALRWRREQQVLKQLQGLASRLQLQTPVPSTIKTNSILCGNGMEPHLLNHPQQQQLEQLEQLERQGSRAATKSRGRRHSGVDNPAFIVHESQLPFPYSYGVYGSQNEFNASVFGLDASQYASGAMSPQNMNPSRTRSLLDLRNVITPMHIVDSSTTAHSKATTKKTTIPDHTSDIGEPMYYTIGSEKDATISKGGLSGTSSSGSKSLPTPLMRNCVSMENLMGGIQMLHTGDTTDAAVTAEQHRRNALLMQHHPLSQNYNPAAVAAAQQQQQQQQQQGGADTLARPQHALPAQQHSTMQQHQQQLHAMQQSRLRQHYPLGMYQPQAWPAPAYPHPQDYWNWPRYAYGMMGVNDARRFVHPFLAGQHNYHPQYHQQQHQQPHQPHHHLSRSTMNSKQSLGSDDFRKYRDVAL